MLQLTYSLTHSLAQHGPLDIALGVHKKEFWNHSFSKKTHTRIENFFAIAEHVNWTSFEDVNVGMQANMVLSQMKIPRFPNRFLSIKLMKLLQVPHFSQMFIRAVLLLILNLFWSLKSIQPHWLSVQFWCSQHQRKHFLRWSGDKGKHLLGRLANRLQLYRLLLAILKRNISHPTACASCLTVSPAACCLCFLAYRAIYR